MSLVSIIIPAYNCSPYIRETIESLLGQEGAIDLEIIVVNDGSTDNTADIARSFGAPVRVFDQPNAGVCSARNHGIREAKGDFIALVDHDDYWLPGKLANQLAAFESHPEAAVVYSDLIYWRPDKEGCFASPATFKTEAEPKGIDPDLSGWIYHRMLLECCPLTSAALVRSSAVHAVGGFDESLPYSEDWDFFLKISRMAPFIKLREKTTLYRQHPNQGSRVARPIDYRTRLVEEAVQKWGLCSQDGRCITSEQFRKQVARFCISFALGHLREGEGSNRTVAAKSLRKAWSMDHGNWLSLAYLMAMAIGWKPE